MKSGSSATLWAFALLLLILLPTRSFALLVPTETEWLAWPDYCRARFVVSADGRTSQYAARVSRQEVELFESRIGDEAWHWLHHYCAGLIYFSRAKSAPSEREAQIQYDIAERQFVGQYQRLHPTNPFFPQATTALAQLYYRMGDHETALKYLHECMENQPKATSCYFVAAQIYRDESELEKARDVLLDADTAVDGQSAEIHYFLGLIFIDLGNLNAAVEHGKKAYALGYPLPGLRTKLERLGRPLE